MAGIDGLNGDFRLVRYQRTCRNHSVQLLTPAEQAINDEYCRIWIWYWQKLAGDTEVIKRSRHGPTPSRDSDSSAFHTPLSRPYGPGASLSRRSVRGKGVERPDVRAPVTRCGERRTGGAPVTRSTSRDTPVLRITRGRADFRRRRVRIRLVSAVPVGKSDVLPAVTPPRPSPATPRRAFPRARQRQSRRRRHLVRTYPPCTRTPAER